MARLMKVLLQLMCLLVIATVNIQGTLGQVLPNATTTAAIQTLQANFASTTAVINSIVEQVDKMSNTTCLSTCTVSQKGRQISAGISLAGQVSVLPITGGPTPASGSAIMCCKLTASRYNNYFGASYSSPSATNNLGICAVFGNQPICLSFNNVLSMLNQDSSNIMQQLMTFFQ